MKYAHAMERSAELLRAALPLMSRYATSLTPISYAVWYDYVSGEHPVLRRAVDDHLARHGLLDEQATRAFYQEHIAQRANASRARAAALDAHSAERLSADMARVLIGMAESVAQAGTQTAQFGDSLSRWEQDLRQTPLAPDLSAMQSSTREMQSAMDRLQSRLTESQREIQHLRTEVDLARSESLLDSLTGLANRRAFDRKLAELLKSQTAPSAASPHSGPSGTEVGCLLLADLDHFKRINDTYGHAFGDEVLKAVGKVLRQNLPEGALAARIGGEEFAVLLPAYSLELAQRLAEQLRTRIAASRIRRHGADAAKTENITLSLGVAPCLSGDAPLTALDRADQALYRSKNEGRDRVSVYAH